MAPSPMKSSQTIQGAAFINIIGNYDAYVLNKTMRKEKMENASRQTINVPCSPGHTLRSPRNRVVTWNPCPNKGKIKLEGIKLRLVHGSPASPDEHLRENTPAERLRELAKKVNAGVVLCGHSHEAFAREVSGTWFINPGSVGRLDDGDPRASYAILEIDHDKVKAQFFRVPYDIQAAVEQMRQTGMAEIFGQVLRQGLDYNHVLEQYGLEPAPKHSGTPADS